MATDRLADALDDLLAAAADALEDGGREAPARRYRRHGRPAEPGLCDVLSTFSEPVEVVPLQGEGGLPGMCQAVLVARLVARLDRCWSPAGEANPGADTIDLASEDLALDGWALVSGISTKAIDGDLFPTAGIACDGTTAITAIPLGPEGQLATWEVTVTVSLSA